MFARAGQREVSELLNSVYPLAKICTRDNTTIVSSNYKV